MNHRPFEDWLLADRPLAPGQNRELRAHLKTCKSCAALAEVNLALRSSQTVRPAAGFALRFETRLATYKTVRRRRALWGVLLLAACSIAIFAWVGTTAFPLLEDSPSTLLVSWLANLAYLFTAVQAISALSSVLWQVIPDLIPATWLTAGGLIFAGLGALWVSTLWKVHKAAEGARP